LGVFVGKGDEVKKIPLPKGEGNPKKKYKLGAMNKGRNVERGKKVWFRRIQLDGCRALTG